MTIELEADDTAVVFSPDTLSILQSIAAGSDSEDTRLDTEPAASMVASVKFMITIEDVKKLRGLGYTVAQINKMKPQEASDIIESDRTTVEG